MDKSPYGWWFPPDISTHGAGIDRIIDVVHGFMAVLFVGWGIFFVYCLIKFRARPGHRASYQLPKAKISKVAEIGVLAFEVFLLVGLSMPVWLKYRNDPPKPADNPLEVRVVAEQFAWNFHYPGADGAFGRTHPRFMAADNLIGLDRGDPAAADDIALNNRFYMPKDRPVVLRMTSKDVIHSIWIPVMRVKQDVIPGMEIPVWFTATETGHFQIGCAQLCGNNHFTMISDLFVQEPEEFRQWQIEQQSSGGEEEEEEDA